MQGAAVHVGSASSKRPMGAEGGSTAQRPHISGDRSTHRLAGRLDEARGFAAAIRKTLPNYGVDDFIGTFRFEPDAVALFRQGARRIGLG